MKLLCIADEDTVRGFALAGIEGVVVRTPEEVRVALLAAEADLSIGLCILTDVVASEALDVVSRIRMEASRPLIAVIAGPQGPMKGHKSLREFVQDAVGISIGDKGE